MGLLSVSKRMSRWERLYDTFHQTLLKQFARKISFFPETTMSAFLLRAAVASVKVLYVTQTGGIPVMFSTCDTKWIT